jgi:hypothetical protein
MSFGAQQSTSSGSTRNIPKYAVPLFKDGLTGIATQQEGNYNPTGGAPTAAATGEIMNTLSGATQDPNSNPELQAVIQSLNQQTGQEWTNQIAPAVTNQAEGAGDLYSTQAQKALGTAATNTQNDYANTIANLEYGNQQNERQAQIGAAGQALGLGQDQLNQLLAVLGSFTGITQSTGSNNLGFSGGL